MQLTVQVVTTEVDGFRLDQVVTQFVDAEKIGVAVGRAVRDWLREIPLRASGRRMRVDVYAAWSEREPRAAADGKPKRRRKKGEADGAES